MYFQVRLVATLGQQLHLVFTDDTPKIPIETFESEESYWRTTNYFNMAVCWLIIYQVGFSSLYVPYYIILKLDLIAEDNIIEKVQTDILCLETRIFLFFKFDLPLWLFKCNIMIPHMILNRENGTVTQNYNPTIRKIWHEAWNHIFYESSEDCCICLKEIDDIDDVNQSKCCKIFVSHSLCFKEKKT